MLFVIYASLILGTMRLLPFALCLGDDEWTSLLILHVLIHELVKRVWDSDWFYRALWTLLPNIDLLTCARFLRVHKVHLRGHRPVAFLLSVYAVVNASPTRFGARMVDEDDNERRHHTDEARIQSDAKLSIPHDC